MGIEILIQDFRGLLVEVSSLPPSREERMGGNRRKRKGNEHQGSKNRMQNEFPTFLPPCSASLSMECKTHGQEASYLSLAGDCSLSTFQSKRVSTSNLSLYPPAHSSLKTGIQLLHLGR